MTTPQLEWMNFERQHDYGFNLGGVIVNLKGPAPDDPINGFTISDTDFSNAITLSQQEAHGPINLFDISWPCEIQTPNSIEIQGSVLATFKLFHSLEFGLPTQGKIRNQEDLQLAIINLGKLCFEDEKDCTTFYPQSTSDLESHSVNGRLWHEALTGYLGGTMHHDLYTRLNDDLTLAIYINLTTFWGNQKLPDPEHKRLVFESILDFLSHIQILQPEDVDPDNPPILGLHSPFREEKPIEVSDVEDIGW
ncbi:hypothetical protein [Pseudomaricurvus sp.]|uniref:hypothetical protein n=1 Tax=Pseudomaricurvus sp. TaxID=2004510 RepID=UPI003F6C37FD